MTPTTFLHPSLEVGGQAHPKTHVGCVPVVGNVVEVAEGQGGARGPVPVDADVVLEARLVEVLVGLRREVAALPVELDVGLDRPPLPVLPGGVEPDPVPEAEGSVAGTPTGALDEGSAEVEDLPRGGPPLGRDAVTLVPA